MNYELKRAGFRAFAAPSGNKALELIAREPIALVISDLKMPDGSGIELLKALNPVHSHSPKLVFVSGYSELTLEEAFDLGAEAVLLKPFDRNILRSTVERILSQKEERWPNRPTRIPVDLEVTLIGGSLGSKRIVNLGRGGFFLKSEAPFPLIGAELGFRLTLSEAQPVVSGAGTVRWIREKSLETAPSGVGIEFNSFETDSRAVLFDYINRQLISAYIPRK